MATVNISTLKFNVILLDIIMGGGGVKIKGVDLPGLLKRHCGRKRKFPQNDKKKLY